MEESEKYSRNKISAGSYDLNKFLYGGYETDIITTIYGPAGSGKTNFCIIASVSQAKKGNKVIFIDTEGGFSVERFRQIAGENSQEAIKNIFLLQPTNFEEQKKAFLSMLKELREKGDIGLIVVDGMTMLYRLELAEAIQSKNEEQIHSINSELAKQMRILAEMARKKNIPIIITNQGYHEFLSEEEIKSGKKKQFQMVGGDILKYWSKCIIELQNERGKRKLVLKKHRSLPEKEMEFEIIREGIKKSFRIF